MSAWEPGPWEVSAARGVDGEYLICAGKGHDYGLVAEVPDYSGEATANLCAAAPDLAEALEYYASPEAWTVYQVEGPDGDYGKRARAALRRAKGEA